jgi:opacity protein-like surface antigen
MKKNLLLAILLVAALTTAGFASDMDGMEDVSSDPNTLTSSPTMEIGLSYGLMNFGGSLSYDNSYGQSNVDIDTEDTPLIIYLSFLSKNDNRWGLYYKTDELSYVGASKSWSTTTFGVFGEIGFSSIKTNIGEGELLPYFGYGLGLGSADYSSSTNSDYSAFEVDFSFGVHYTIQSFEVSAALYRRAVAIYDDNSNTLTHALNGINIGVGYKF